MEGREEFAGLDIGIAEDMLIKRFLNLKVKKMGSIGRVLRG